METGQFLKMKYKLKPENKQVKNISELKTLPTSFVRSVSATIKVKPTPKTVNQIKLPVGICFFVSLIFSLLTKVSLPIVRVLLARVTINGTPNNVPQITYDTRSGICSLNFTNDAIVKPKLIPNQKTKFQNLFFVNHLACLAVTGFVVTCLGSLNSIGIFLKKVSVCFGSLCLFLQNVAKSSIKITCNLWYQIYTCIISQIVKFNKQITSLFIWVCLSLCCSINLTLASESYSKEQLASVISKAERVYKIPPGLLSAIAQVESSNRAYAINIAGNSIYAKSLSEAKRIAQKKINSGVNNMDLGIMQLNWRWHGSRFANIEEMLQSEKNIEYAAKLLKSLYLQHGNWQKAIRYYHSAKSEHNRKYSRKVAMHWLSIN